jgi:molecular chaperone DnaK (HSP70)
VYDFYLGLDFGTTRTNASWLKKRRDDDSWVADVLEVDDVGGWNPDFNSQPRQPGRQVPSQSLYVRRPDEPGDVYYGYEALSRASDPSDELVTPVHIIDAKPVDGYPAPGTSRKLDKLKTWGMIEQDDDVEINFMTWTLLHVKKVLTEDQGMTPHSAVQIYIGCPVAWNQSDRRRFRSNVAKAARRANLGVTYRRHQGSAVERNDGTFDYDVQVSDDMQGVTVITETEAAGLYLILTSKMRDLAILVCLNNSSYNEVYTPLTLAARFNHRSG